LICTKNSILARPAWLIFGRSAEMIGVRKYLVPAVIAALTIAAAIFAGSFWSRAEAPREKPPELVSVRHGRVLYVVAEKEGAYVGEEFVPYPMFEKFIKDRARVFAPDYFIVLGTDEARYGDVASAFLALHSATHAPGTIATQTVPIGTRRPVVAAGGRFWDY
jgi:hypothetical protein